MPDLAIMYEWLKKFKSQHEDYEKRGFHIFYARTQSIDYWGKRSDNIFGYAVMAEALNEIIRHKGVTNTSSANAIFFLMHIK